MTDIDRLGYWLLNVVVEYRFPLQGLQADNWQEVMNSPPPRASGDEIFRGVVQHFDLGLITAARRGEVPCRWSAAEVEDVFENGEVPADRWAYYGLTKAGGATWERAARPDWQRFIDFIGNAPCRITGTDRMLVDRYFEFLRGVQYQPDSVIDDSVRRDLLEPWDATYWKRLATGHPIQFHLRDTEPGRYFRFDHPDLATSEFARGTPEWYTHPGV